MEICSFEIAKKLKEKGFREDCIAKVNIDNTITFNHVFDNDIRTVLKCHNKLNPYVDAPTISQVLKWLRKNHKLHISTKPYPCEDGLMWLYEVRKFSSVLVCMVVSKTGFQEPEQAALTGIKYVVDNLI